MSDVRKRKNRFRANKEYDVGNILNCRYTEGRGLEYQIRWKGWAEKYNSWEHESNLHCDGMVDQFHQEKGSKLLYFLQLKGDDASIRKELVVEDEVDESIMEALGPEIKERFRIVKLEQGTYCITLKTPASTVPADRASVQTITIESDGEETADDHPIVNGPTAKSAELLQAWQNRANLICARGGDAPIRVENLVDDDPLPSASCFVYCTQVKGNNVKIPNKALIGCKCRLAVGGSCKATNGCCASPMGSEFAYMPGGFVSLDPGRPIYECNSRCVCNETCINRVVQKGRKIELCIFKTSDGRGWGVKAIEMIKKGSFVSEYVGEVITKEASDTRVDTTYMFNMDFADKPEYVVDAKYYGNVARFINHSCEPNLCVYSVWVEHLIPALPRLAFFAIRDIAPGEELTYDYFKQSADISMNSNESDDEQELEVGQGSQRAGNDTQTSCKCSQPNCRGVSF